MRFEVCKLLISLVPKRQLNHYSSVRFAPGRICFYRVMVSRPRLHAATFAFNGTQASRSWASTSSTLRHSMTTPPA